MFYIVEGMYGAQLVTFAAVHCETENVILSVFTIVILKIMLIDLTQPTTKSCKCPVYWTASMRQ